VISHLVLGEFDFGMEAGFALEETKEMGGKKIKYNII